MKFKNIRVYFSQIYTSQIVCKENKKQISHFGRLYYRGQRLHTAIQGVASVWRLTFFSIQESRLQSSLCQCGGIVVLIATIDNEAIRYIIPLSSHYSESLSCTSTSGWLSCFSTRAFIISGFYRLCGGIEWFSSEPEITMNLASTGSSYALVTTLNSTHRLPLMTSVTSATDYRN